jgi:hypothetical protein
MSEERSDNSDGTDPEISGNDVDADPPEYPEEPDQPEEDPEEDSDEPPEEEEEEEVVDDEFSDVAEDGDTLDMDEATSPDGNTVPVQVAPAYTGPRVVFAADGTSSPVDELGNVQKTLFNGSYGFA